VCRRAVYDDGGFSGATIDRPALKRLLDDIAARRVDTVVVYKIGRRTRSLTDFAKIIEILDPGARPFVSVTQQFNATTSNGAPDPERLVVLCPLITGGAVLEYSPTEKSPPFGKMFTRPACLCRPRPLVWARIPAENRGFST